MIKRIKQLVMSWWTPRQTQRQRVLATLQKGPATNRQLSRIAPRFSARILELRRMGNDIDFVRDGRVVVYKLVDR
jgi:hypothetical protein